MKTGKAVYGQAEKVKRKHASCTLSIQLASNVKQIAAYCELAICTYMYIYTI